MANPCSTGELKAILLSILLFFKLLLLLLFFLLFLSKLQAADIGMGVLCALLLFLFIP